MYHITDQRIPCDWADCKAAASTQVFNSNLSENAWLCNFHKRVAQINLEQFDRIHAPAANRNHAGRPTVEPLPHVKPEKRPVQNDPEQWKKDAAVKAEAAAKPIEPSPSYNPVITSIPTPRRRTQ